MLGVLVSALVLVPCFWHDRIAAGDLGSHTYNAYLATLIEKGHAPGLYIAPQWTNILFDVLLSVAGSAIGFLTAKRLIVSATVLVFFWGAFAFIAAQNKRPPWLLTPAIAAIAYGYTFHMGFFNFYLGVGLGLLGIALIRRGTRLAVVGAALISLLVLFAHTAAFAWFAGTVLYMKLAERLVGSLRGMLFVAALGGVAGLHFWITRYRHEMWHTSYFYLLNGADQIVLFGNRYYALYLAALILTAGIAVYAVARDRPRPALIGNVRIALELWALLLWAVIIIPDAVYLPQYKDLIGLYVIRLTCISAILVLCILGSVKPRLWHLVAVGGWAAVFFFWLYQDTGIVVDMEKQTEALVSQLPQNRRVSATIGPLRGSRLWWQHFPDRACIGRCYFYSNYEPVTEQFRIRVRPGSPIQTASQATMAAMDLGEYVAKPEDLPMTLIYHCDANDLTRICMRDLTAGEKTCPGCFNYTTEALNGRRCAIVNCVWLTN